MDDMWINMKSAINRRSFMKNGLTAAAIATTGVGLLGNHSAVLAEQEQEVSSTLEHGDAALLRFAAAAEILETDFWEQYNELAGIQDGEVPGEAGIPPIPRLFRCWTPTCPSTSRTILTMKTPIRAF